MIDSITPIPALRDNYIWMLQDHASRHVWVVDPGDAAPVIHTLQQHHLILAGILLTHHHMDHSGGIAALVSEMNHIPVIGSHRSKIPFITQPVRDQDEINCLGQTMQVMEIPGHTLDHTAFYINGKILFSGDTLFSAGCGRIFEGTPEMMYQSLCKLLKLNDTTRLYCGHEYTLANLSFAEIVEPHNTAIQQKKHAAAKADNSCTLPSTLHDEKTFNPFLRCDIPEVIAATEKRIGHKMKTATEVFTALREWKSQTS